MAPKFVSKIEDTGRKAARWAVNAIRGPDTLDEGLSMLTAQLGMSPSLDETSTEYREPVTTARPSPEYAQTLLYAPDMDGQAEPGEVVWAPVMLGEDPIPQERAVTVLGRRKHVLLGALISADPRHAQNDKWLYIGSGPWDSKMRPCWIRLDKILEVPESGIRRSGIFMPKRRFDRIATKLRTNYQWS